MQPDPSTDGIVLHEGITLQPHDLRYVFSVPVGQRRLSLCLTPPVYAEWTEPDGRIRRISDTKLEALIATLFEEYADG